MVIQKYMNSKFKGFQLINRTDPELVYHMTPLDTLQNPLVTWASVSRYLNLLRERNHKFIKPKHRTNF